MEYSEEQYRMLERISGEVNWGMLPGLEIECVRYLIDQGLAQYREDIGPGHVALTEEGRRVLHLHDVHIRQKQEEQDDRDRLREEEATAKRAERDSDRRFQVRLSFLQAFLSFLTGLISGIMLGNLDRIVVIAAKVIALIQKIQQ